MTLHHSKRRRHAVAVCLAAFSLFFAAAGPAAADPTPNSGPTVGGTVVSDAVPTGVTFTEVFAGHTLGGAFGDDGNVYMWGIGGSLGDGTTSSSSTPVRVEAPAGVMFTQVSTGEGFSLAVGSDGNTYAWGSNSNGQLGDGTTTSQTVPTLVQTPVGVTFTQVEAGPYHSLGLGSDGLIYAWGYNGQGRLGDGTTTSRLTPVVVQTPAGMTFTTLSAGDAHSVAINTAGAAYSWGDYPLGDGTNAGSLFPVAVAAPAGVSFDSIVAAGSRTLAIAKDGTTYGWGNNLGGSLGDGTSIDRLTPVPVHTPAGVTFTQVDAYAGQSIAVGSDGLAYSWGLNNSGTVGDGTTIPRQEPVLVNLPAGVTVTSVASGNARNFAVGSDGVTYSWGNNSAGSLGNGTSGNFLQPTPAPVATDVEVTEVTFGGVPGTGLAQADGQWSVSTPPGCGPVDVVVTFVQFGQVGTRTFPDGFVFGVAPAITASPSSSEVVAGDTATLSATASGDDTPTVQWQQAPAAADPWTDIPGATAASIDVTPDNTTHYRAVFTNCNGQATTEESTVTVVRAPVITTPSLPDGPVNVTYDQTVEATGTGPITFAVTAGSLPPGLSLDPATGVISGTPTQVGSFPFTVTASNRVGEDTQEYTIVIGAGTTPTTPTDPATPTTPTDEPVGPKADGHLAWTGGEISLPWVIGGGLLILLGAGAMVLTRLRRPGA